MITRNLRQFMVKQALSPESIIRPPNSKVIINPLTSNQLMARHLREQRSIDQTEAESTAKRKVELRKLGLLPEQLEGLTPAETDSRFRNRGPLKAPAPRTGAIEMAPIPKPVSEPLSMEAELQKLQAKFGPHHAQRRGFILNPLQHLLDAASSSRLQVPSDSIARTINLQTEINKLGNPEMLGPRARARYFRLTDRLAALNKGPGVMKMLNRVSGATGLSTTPGRVTAAMNSTVGRPVTKGLGVAAVLNAPWAVYDNRKDFNLENLGYLGQSKPWLEFARDASGLHHASTDMFDEVGSGAFWGELPGEIGRSSLDTGKAWFVDPITRAVDALAPSAKAQRKQQFDAVDAGGYGGASRWR